MKVVTPGSLRLGFESCWSSELAPPVPRPLMLERQLLETSIPGEWVLPSTLRFMGGCSLLVIFGYVLADTFRESHQLLHDVKFS